MPALHPLRGRARRAANRSLACLLGTVLGLATAGGARPASGAEPVVIARATTIAFPIALEALGTVRANEAVEVRAQISERVTAIRFEEGDHVEAGAVLVELDSITARADVAAAHAALVESEAQLRRAESLREARSLAQAEYDARLAERDARRAALAVAESSLAHTTVRAPFEGRVGLRRVSLGTLVTPETVITTLDDTNPVKVDFDVPETVLANLKKGSPISARSAAWRDATFNGEIASIDTRVDPISRTVTARAVVPNPDDLLRPGMFVTVSVLRKEDVALVVPEQAIMPEQSRQYVLVVDVEGMVEKREVRTGRRQPALVEVVSGLAQGERVVAEGTQRARPGRVVEVVGEIDVAALARDAT